MARRQRGEGAIFVRRDGRHVGSIELPPDPDGTRRRKHVYGRTTAEVVRKMGEQRRALAERGDLPTADETVKHWLTYWLDEIAAPRSKPATVRFYRKMVTNYLIPHLGRHRLPALSPAHIRSMHQAMLTAGKSPNTVAAAHRTLSAALTDAYRWNRVPRNAAKVIPPPSKVPAQRPGLTFDEAIRVLTVAGQDQRLGSTWLFALMLGLRQGERLGLRWSHVDLDAGTVDIAWKLEHVPGGVRDDLEHVHLHGAYYLTRPKTGRSIRVMPLPEPVLAALRQRQAVADAERPHYRVDLDLVWCRPSGLPIDSRTDHAAWTALLKAAGVPHRTLHEARNTAATLLFDSGVDEGVIKAILGHSNVLMSRSYQRVSQEMARRALDDLGTRLALPAPAAAASRAPGTPPARPGRRAAGS